METFLRKGMQVRVKNLKEIKNMKHISNCERDGLVFACSYRGQHYMVFGENDYKYINELGIIDYAGYDTYVRVRMEDGTVQLFPSFALEPVPFNASKDDTPKVVVDEVNIVGHPCPRLNDFKVDFAFNTDISSEFVTDDMVEIAKAELLAEDTNIEDILK